MESYNPASYRGGILRLHDARAAELGLWLDLVAVRGEVIVQFWFRPGEAAVTLGPGEVTGGGTDTGAVAAVFVNNGELSGPPLRVRLSEGLGVCYTLRVVRCRKPNCK